MGDIWRAITGGSKTESKATAGPVDVTPAAFKSLQGPFANVLSSILASGGQPAPYTGKLQPDLTGTEQNLISQIAGSVGTGSANAGYLSDVLGGKYLPGGDNANPFLDAAIKAAQRPTLESLTQTLTRDLPGRFTANGQFVQPQGSSPFDYAAAIATRGAANALGDIATNISANAYKTERQLQQNAVQLNQGEVTNTINALQASTLPTLIEQQGISNGLDLYKSKVNSVLQALQIISGVTRPVIGQQSTSNTETTQYKGVADLLKVLIPAGA